MKWFKRAFSLLVVLLSLMIAVSCTTERDAVDKTDDLALDKRLFEGEFFLRQTIVDLPYTADYAFIGESNDGKIVKWKITRDWLIAYSVWDKLTTLDTNESISVNETPIVAYRIVDHYDIVPTENPTTGEALPVLVANRDRPWNERRYFSLASQAYSGVSNFELKYLRMTQEWNNPFYRAGLATATDWEFYSHDGTFVPPKKYREYTAIQNEAERKKKEIEWFQFYATEYFEPIRDWRYIYTWEDVEEFLGNEPARVTYRYVFTKVNRDVVGRREYDLATRSFKWRKGPKDNGFRPLQFKDELFRQFGYFTNTFRGYDNYHGYRDDNVHILANYWNTAWANEGKEWNFTCEKFDDPNDCFNTIKYQQKMVFISSPKTPLRMIPINCAIAKDFNHALLAARYAAMNPGSDTREFEKWYVDNYENDFFTEVNGVKVRDRSWWLKSMEELRAAHPDWEDKCFVPEKHAWIQNWDGSFIDETEDGEIDEDIRERMDQYINDMVVLVRNPVEGYIEERDGRALFGYTNYHNYDSNSRANAARICVAEAEARAAEPGKLNYYESCVTTEEQMTELYVNEAGFAEWRGDRWDCKVYEENESCPDGYVEAKAACVLNEERRCVTENGVPVLRHKYMNGNAKGAMLNWVDKPTEFGILGVAQWNVNPETGMSMGGGANTAGSVLAWVATRAVELARMIIDGDDPAAWDFADLLDPDYYKHPESVWDNNPSQYEPKSLPGQNVKPQNSMKMINRPRGALNPNLPLEMQGNVLGDFMEDLSRDGKRYDRFDFSTIKGSKWESRMVPYSVKKALFPWTDPSQSPSYSDAEREIMEPWFGGPEMMNAELIRFTDARARDYDFDESFLDGTIINFIKQKQKELRQTYPDWDGNEKDEYSQDLIYAIYNELEKLIYKGVAAHEMGHVVGLRHNFAASADRNNYGDGYFRTENYPTLKNEIEEFVRSEMADPNYNKGTIGDKVWSLRKGFQSDMNYYNYASIMDYQREPYTHASGLGKYDKAALKFVYGRSIEQYMVEDGKDYGLIVMEGDDNDPNPELRNRLRDENFPDFVRVNTPFIGKDGKLVRVDKPREVLEYYDENGNKIRRMVPRFKRTMMGRVLHDEDSGEPLYQHDCDGDDVHQYYCDPNTTYLVNDGSQYKYLFVSDEKSREEPIGNVFDGGYRGVDMIRQMTDMDNMFYFLRYFRRGNPKFREFRGRTSWHMILHSLLRQYVFVHFMLDYNFHTTGKWFRYVPLFNHTDDTPFGCAPPGMPPPYDDMVYKVPVDENTFIEVENFQCIEHSRALAGEEYWIDDHGNLRTVTPFGVADHVLAGMKGVQYLLFDSFYRPSAGDYMMQDVKSASHLERFGYDDCVYNADCRMSPDTYTCDQDTNRCVLSSQAIGREDRYEERIGRLSPHQNKLFMSTDNYIPGIKEEAEVFGLNPDGFIEVPASIGRYHRDRYDIQDNPDIYYDRVIRRGFGLEKMVTLFTLTNAGWIDGKYRRESRANSIDQRFDGVRNIMFNVLSDIATEESVMTFSPYCVDTQVNTLLGEKMEVVRVNYPIDLLANFAAVPGFWSGDESVAYEPIENLCARVDPENPGRYAPVHASWIYFDKMWPNYWAMGNLANISADTSVLHRWTSHVIPVHERSLFTEPDVNEDEFLSKDENYYYRARIPISAMDNADSYGYRLWRDCRQELLKGDMYADVSACINEVRWPSWHDPNESVRFDTVEEFSEYLAKKYGRYSPSFRIVQHAKVLKEQEVYEASSGSREPWSRLSIMETTLDQLNSFAKDHFGMAAFYVQNY